MLRGLANPVEFTLGLAASAVAHTALLILAAAATPGFLPDQPTSVRDELLLVETRFIALSEPEPALLEAATPGRSQGEVNRCDTLPGGAMGIPVAESTTRYGIQGFRDNPDPHIARDSGTETFVVFTIFPGTQGRMPAVSVRPWGRDDEFGNDDISAEGNVWGDSIGVSRGTEGEGVSGTCKFCGAGGLVPLPPESRAEKCSASLERVGLRTFPASYSDNTCGQADL